MSQTYAQIKREQADHIAAIKKNEIDLAKDPQRYAARVKRFATLGYVLYGCLVVFAILCAIAVYYIVAFIGVSRISLYLILFAGGFLLSTLSSLIIRRQKSDTDTVLSRSEAPTLWQSVDAITKEIKAPSVDEIRIDNELNASALQWPRFGLFGKVQNILTIGAPLLMSMSENELKGIIGHEMGHFAGEHGQKTGFLYRSAMLFQNLYNRLNGGNGGGYFLRIIVNWFFPKLEQLSLPLSRIHEFEADRAEVRISGKEGFTSAMYRLGPLSRWFYGHIYEELLRRNPENPMRWLEQRLSAGVPSHIFQEALEKSIQSETKPEDTHPCLRERLEAQGCPAPSVEELEKISEEFNTPREVSAYSILVDPTAKAKIEQIQGLFYTVASKYALERGLVSSLAEDIDYSKPRVASGEPVAATWVADTSLTPLQQFDAVVERGKGLNEAQKAANLLAFIETAKDDSFLRFAVASELSMDQADQVIDLLNEEVQQDSVVGFYALSILTSIYDERNQTEKAAHYHALLAKRQKELEGFGKMLGASSPGKISGPRVSPACLERIQRIIESCPEVTSAYLCNEGASAFGKKLGEATVLYFDPLPPQKAKWRWLGIEGNAAPMTEKLNELMPGAIFALPLVEGKAKAIRKLKKNPDVIVLRAPAQ